MRLNRTAIALLTLVCMQAAQAYDPAMELEREHLLSLYHGSETAVASNRAAARYISQTAPVEMRADTETSHAIPDTAESSRFISYSEVSF